MSEANEPAARRAALAGGRRRRRIDVATGAGTASPSRAGAGAKASARLRVWTIRLAGFGSGEPVDGARRALAAVRIALAVVIGLRLALSPFAAAVGQPSALWLPRGTGLVFPRPPPAALVVGLQLLGIGAAVLHLRRRRLAPLVVAWACLLVLAGVRTSLGKILHNDVLLVLATAPVLLAGRDPDDREARTGLDAAAAIVLLSYLAAGWWKLLGSGPAWALSDNLRWALAAGRGGARWSALAGWLVATPVACIGLASGILALETGSFVVWLRPRIAPLFVAAATVMHVGTWLVLGLDYFAHLATVAVVLLGWARMRR